MSKLPPFFIRRFDSHKFEKAMRKCINGVYFETKGDKQAFKLSLAEVAIDTYLYYKFNFDIYHSDISENERDSIINYIIEVFNPLMDLYYREMRKLYPNR